MACINIEFVPAIYSDQVVDWWLQEFNMIMDMGRGFSHLTRPY